MAQMNSPDRNPFPLFALPTEIRITIYSYVFAVPSWQRHRSSCAVSARDATCPHCGPCSLINALEDPPLYPPVRILVDGSGILFQPWSTPMAAANKCFPEWPSVVASWPTERTAILRTCKAIYEEAQEVLYNNTLFIVHLSFCSEHMRRALGITCPRGDALPITFPYQLQESRHLAVELQIHNHLDVHKLISYLLTLKGALPAPHRLKSKTITLNFQGLERLVPFHDMPSAPWEEFARSVARVASGAELRVISGPCWAEQGKKELELLENAVGGRIRFLRPGKTLCAGSVSCSPVRE